MWDIAFNIFENIWIIKIVENEQPRRYCVGQTALCLLDGGIGIRELGPARSHLACKSFKIQDDGFVGGAIDPIDAFKCSIQSGSSTEFERGLCLPLTTHPVEYSGSIMSR